VEGAASVVALSGGSGSDTVVLVVSELFTNAVRDVGGVTSFRLEAGPGAMTVGGPRRQARFSAALALG